MSKAMRLHREVYKAGLIAGRKNYDTYLTAVIQYHISSKMNAGVDLDSIRFFTKLASLLGLKVEVVKDKNYDLVKEINYINDRANEKEWCIAHSMGVSDRLLTFRVTIDKLRNKYIHNLEHSLVKELNKFNELYHNKYPL